MRRENLTDDLRNWQVVVHHSRLRRFRWALIALGGIVVVIACILLSGCTYSIRGGVETKPVPESRPATDECQGACSAPTAVADPPTSPLQPLDATFATWMDSSLNDWCARLNVRRPKWELREEADPFRWGYYDTLTETMVMFTLTPRGRRSEEDIRDTAAHEFLHHLEKVHGFKPYEPHGADFARWRVLIGLRPKR